jgi:hypothetical protein
VYVPNQALNFICPESDGHKRSDDTNRKGCKTEIGKGARYKHKRTHDRNRRGSMAVTKGVHDSDRKGCNI